MFKYIIPFYYTIHSRAQGIHFPSYIAMVILPQLLLCILNSNIIPNKYFFISFIVSFIGMLSIYEIGYITNDTICIKNDPHPTNRISLSEQNYLEKNIKPIFIIKILLSIICTATVSLLPGSNSISSYVVCLIVLLTTYCIHNYFRSWINFATIFILTTINYFATASVLTNGKNVIISLLIIIFTFSLPKTYFYIKRKLTGKTDKFGFAVYYLIESLVFIVFIVFDVFNRKLIFIPLLQFLWRSSVISMHLIKGDIK